ncbi:hypothetical protein [Streptomyces sp. sk2.1]|uniref:hypothetical protein n=1 Tax=Streptomyces sp. sk2.1 TaxID=2478959 RepID=UPI0011E74B4A|nr:hypothetical protein [Streptomyces sp. sk2.1]TXS63815.1 hypothetical protein EAO76_40470 [Streptomyces sp. sk2.1]
MSDRSDRDHLLHIVDRARRGAAIPAELDQLAAGIAELEAETAKLIRWHREDGTALAKARRAVEHLADRYRGAEVVVERLRTRLAEEAEDRQQAEAAIARARAELHALNSETRLNPVAMAGRRDAVARIRAALDEPHAGVRPDGKP